MISYNKEYFKNNLYFFLKDRGDKISLYYSVADTLSESRKKDEKKEFSKKHEDKLKKIIHRFLNSGKKVTKKEIDKGLNDVEKSGEVDELIDTDGTFLNSKIPFLNMALHPRKTTDQTVAMSRVTNDPVTRGYRVYWGESEEKDGKVVNEIDYSDAFGYEETKDKDFKDTVKTLKQMGSDNAEERALEQGKDPKLDKNKKKNGSFTRQRLSELETIEEQQKKQMIKMVEDILAKKSKENSDVVGKDTGVSKILNKNLQAIKKLAEREGISINQLIKALKSSE